MKTHFFKFLGAALLAFALASTARAQLSPTAISASPSSAYPNDSVTFTVTVSNSNTTTNFTGTADFSIVLTNMVTGATFTVTGNDISPTGGILSNATVDTDTNKVTPGTGTFTFTGTVPPQTTQAGNYRATVTMSDAKISSTTWTITTSTYSVSTSVLTISGNPDFQITSLTYASGTSYVGGNVIPMTMTFRNNIATDSVYNVPYVPGANSTPTYFRIQVVLSTNAEFGDSDDFQLTYFDIDASALSTGVISSTATLTGNGGLSYLNADGVDRTITWSQLLPGNYVGSYYVIAKINSLSSGAVTENNPAALTVNGNDVWADTAATRIALTESSFPTVYLASTTGSASGSGYSDNPSVSDDGRYVAFVSDSTDLNSDDTDSNAYRDVFLYDNQTAGVRRLSKSAQGVEGNGASSAPAISGSARYVAFASDATNLVNGDTNGFTDIFVVDTQTGNITLESVGPSSVQANGSCYRPSISYDGRYLAFESSATNLIAAGTSTGVTHVYLRDRTLGTTTLVSQSTAGVQGNGNSTRASISADGGYVAFASLATNLGGTVGSGVSNIYLRDVSGGTTTLASFGTSSAAADGNSYSPSINRNTGVTSGVSADGRYVAFSSLATNLVASDTNTVSDVFVYDRSAGTITRVSVSTSGTEGTDPTTTTTGTALGSINPSISADGRYVAFASLDSNLTAGDYNGQYSSTDANGAMDVFVRDRDASASGTYDTNVATTIVSVSRFGYQTTSATGTASTAASDIYPMISGNGRYVAFPSDAEGMYGLSHTTTNLLSTDANGYRDVFLFDRRTNVISATTGSDPSVTITSPGTGSSSLVNSTLTITASATAAVGTVASVQFYANGVSLATLTAYPYTTTWTPSATGTYTLSALVTDSFGNQGVSTSVIVTINAPPTVSITSPTAGTLLPVGTAQTVTASAAVSTNGATISSVQFYANGASIGTATGSPYSVSWTPTSAGNYTLTALATDSLSSQTTSSAVTVSVGSTPTVTVTAFSGTLGVNVAQTIGATASSPNGSIASVQFYVNGTSIGTDTTYPYTMSWTPTSVGTYSITASVTDSIGTQATSAAVSATVASASSNAPGVSLAVPSTIVNVNVAQTLTATAVAVTGAIAQVQFFANGVSIGTCTGYPYSISWTPANSGTYTLTAVATDDSGNQGTSSSVTVYATSNGTPTVALTYPSGNVTVTVNSPQILTAEAVAGTGSYIVQVQFLANGTVLGTKTTYPFSLSWTPTTPGTYTITAEATDNLGAKTTSAGCVITVSTGSPPSVSLTSPVGGATLAVNAPQTLVATASSSTGSIASVAFLVDGVSLGTKTSYPYTMPWTPGSAGTYVLTALATDNLGLQTLSSNVTVSVTTGSAPTVTMTNPTAGSSYSVGTTLTLAAAAADADGTITSVQFYANGTSLGIKTAAPYSLSWTPGSAGNYTLTAVATDNSGNTTTSAAVGVTIVANTAPTISITSPTAGQSFGLGTGVVLGANVTDTDGTIDSVQFFANGVLVGTVTSAPYVVSWTPHVAGNYTITATATDNTANATTAAAVAVQITAGAAPTVSISTPASYSTYLVNTTIAFAATATSHNGPIAQVQFYVDGSLLTGGGTNPDTTSPYTVSWTPTAAGTYTLTAVATDSAGMATTSTAVTVNISGDVAPTISLTSPSNGLVTAIGNPVVLTATAGDTDGTVTSVVFYANGSKVASTVLSPYSATWTPTVAGNYTLFAQATDNAGNVASSSSVTVTVSTNTAPKVTVTAPASGTRLRVSNSTILTAAASDSDGTIASVVFYANGTSIAKLTAAPYTTGWTPSSEGTYKITAVATDNSGTAATSSAATVFVVGSADRAADVIYTGTCVGLTESGNFTAAYLSSGSLTFIARSSAKTYFYSGVEVDSGGGFSVTDSSGTVLLSGTVSDTGVSGLLGGGSQIFIGTAVTATTGAAPAGLYSGSLSGRTGSTLTGIVGGNGSLALHLSDTDASFADAGFTTLNSSGNFTLTTVSGNKFSGKIDTSTGFLNATLTGGPGGTLLGALVSSGKVSDGFLLNVSTRGLASSGDNVLIAGFVVQGTTTKPVLMRAIGPTLTTLGLSGALSNPRLDLYVSGNSTAMASNDNWGGGSILQAAFGQAGAFSLSTASLDAALYSSLSPAVYSAKVSGVGSASGIALVEIYDLDDQSAYATQKITNLSTRGYVGTGDQRLMMGFVVSGTTPKQVLIRAAGPALVDLGLSSSITLANPLLQLLNKSGTVVRENDDWSAGNDVQLVNTMATSAGAFSFSSGSRDAVLLVSLQPGTYNVIVSGVNNTTGIALVELYDIESN